MTTLNNSKNIIGERDTISGVAMHIAASGVLF